MANRPKAGPGANTPVGKQQLNVYITEETRGLLKAILERDGVPYSAQIDRAVRLWAKEKGIEASHVAATRKGA